MRKKRIGSITWATFWLMSWGRTSAFAELRITEDGEIRITEDGEQRLTEGKT